MRIIKQYIDHNFSRRSNGAKIDWIVIHYAGIVGAQGRAKLVADSLCRSSKSDCDDKLKRTASTHYIVGDDGIYQLVRDRHRAWHCGGYSSNNKCAACNDNSIGIDLVERKWNTNSGSVSDNDWYFSERVFMDGADLVAHLADLYGIKDDHIIRHFDVTGKKCPRPFVGDDLNVVLGETHNHEWLLFKQRIRDAR
jgi:N-acetyl-anhydromuramyl-L-alanine amidase AmpD